MTFRTLALALTALVGMMFAATREKAPAGPTSFVLQPGKRYRFFLSATPALTEAQKAAISAAGTAAGAQNIMFSSDARGTLVQYTRLVYVVETYSQGQIVSGLSLLNIQEVKS